MAQASKDDQAAQITRELIDLAQEGDSEALNALMERSLPRVLRVVRMKRGPFLGRHLDDDDLAQEVMIRVWKSLQQYDPAHTADDPGETKVRERTRITMGAPQDELKGRRRREERAMEGAAGGGCIQRCLIEDDAQVRLPNGAPHRARADLTTPSQSVWETQVSIARDAPGSSKVFIQVADHPPTKKLGVRLRCGNRGVTVGANQPLNVRDDQVNP